MENQKKELEFEEIDVHAAAGDNACGGGSNACPKPLG